jgi:hypothetical protein
MDVLEDIDMVDYEARLKTFRTGIAIMCGVQVSTYAYPNKLAFKVSFANAEGYVGEFDLSCMALSSWSDSALLEEGVRMVNKLKVSIAESMQNDATFGFDPNKLTQVQAVGWDGQKAWSQPVPEVPPLSMTELYAKVEGKADKARFNSKAGGGLEALAAAEFEAVKEAWGKMASLELTNPAIKGKIEEVE